MRGPNITLVAPDAKYDEEMRVIFSDLITMGYVPVHYRFFPPQL
jgi:hypothetical protein